MKLQKWKASMWTVRKEAWQENRLEVIWENL
jgi:hypothetical protein